MFQLECMQIAFIFLDGRHKTIFIEEHILHSFFN